MSLALDTNEAIAWTGLGTVFPVDTTVDVWLWVKWEAEGTPPKDMYFFGINGAHAQAFCALLYYASATAPAILASFGSANNNVDVLTGEGVDYPMNNEWTLCKMRLRWTATNTLELLSCRFWSETLGDTGNIDTGVPSATTWGAPPTIFSIGTNYRTSFDAANYVVDFKCQYPFVSELVDDNELFALFTQYIPQIAAQQAGVELLFDPGSLDEDIYTLPALNFQRSNVTFADVDINDNPPLLTSLPSTMLPILGGKNEFITKNPMLGNAILIG